MSEEKKITRLISKRVQVYLPPYYAKKFEAIVKDRIEDESTIAREAIKEYIDKKEHNRF